MCICVFFLSRTTTGVKCLEASFIYLLSFLSDFKPGIREELLPPTVVTLAADTFDRSQIIGHKLLSENRGWAFDIYIFISSYHLSMYLCIYVCTYVSVYHLSINYLREIVTMPTLAEK